MEIRFDQPTTGTVYFISGPGYNGNGWRVEAPIINNVAVLDQAPPSSSIYLSWYYSGDENNAAIGPTTPRRAIPFPILDSRSFDIEITPPAEPIVAGENARYGVRFIDSQLAPGEWFNGEYTLEIDGRVANWPWYVTPEGVGSFDIKLPAGEHAIRVLFHRLDNGVVRTDSFHADTASEVMTVNVAPAPGTLPNLGDALPPIGAETTFIGKMDFNGDGWADWVYFDSSKSQAFVRIADRFNGDVSQQMDLPVTGDQWTLAAVGDKTGVGGTLVWKHKASGRAYVWNTGNGIVASQGFVNASAVGLQWRLAGLGAVTGTASELVWVNQDSGQVAMWTLSGFNVGKVSMLNHRLNTDREWKVESVYDFNHDGNADILWRTATSRAASYSWVLNGTRVIGGDAILTFNAG